MSQRTTFTIPTPPNTEGLPKTPAKALFGAFSFSTLSLVLGFLEYKDSSKIGFLHFGGSIACMFLSMLIAGTLLRFKKEHRFAAHQKVDGIHLHAKAAILILSATTSLVGTALIFIPGNIEAIPLLWIIAIGAASAGWSLFVVAAAVSVTQSYTVLSACNIRISRIFQKDKNILWDDCPEPYMVHSQTVVLRVDDKEIAVSTGTEATDPRIMAALISYYRAHPEHRHELTTGQAIERLRTGHLPIDWTLAPQKNPL